MLGAVAGLASAEGVEVDGMDAAAVSYPASSPTSPRCAVTRRLRAADLDVAREGEGPPVLFVHGSVLGAEASWRRQLPLARDWTLLLANRPGFGASPPLERGDFELEAPLFAELLGEGAHLVGHSYGAVIALLAAAQRPEAVRSLTVSEPGALRLAGSEEAEAMVAGGEALFARRRGDLAGGVPAHVQAGHRLGAGDAGGAARGAAPGGGDGDARAPALAGRDPAGGAGRGRASRPSSSPAVTPTSSRRSATRSPGRSGPSAR